MENDELDRLDLLAFDEKAETWFLDTREARRIALNRQTLDGLVQLYNSIHRGSPLQLVNRRDLRRIEDGNQRLSETVRDLYLRLDRRERRRNPLLVRAARRLIPALLSRLRQRRG
jgi:hypothetical protein